MRVKEKSNVLSVFLFLNWSYKFTNICIPKPVMNLRPFSFNLVLTTSFNFWRFRRRYGKLSAKQKVRKKWKLPWNPSLSGNAGQMEIKIRLLSNDRRPAKVSHSNRSFQTQSTAFRSEPFAPILADLFSTVWLVGSWKPENQLREAERAALVVRRMLCQHKVFRW
jgi:hypothetical protein